MTYVLIEAVAEVERLDQVHPAGFPPTRDGVRLALAVAQDELTETLDAWRGDRCKCEIPLCGHATWEHVRGEAVQVIAILLRMLRELPARTEAGQ